MNNEISLKQLILSSTDRYGNNRWPSNVVRAAEEDRDLYAGLKYTIFDEIIKHYNNFHYNFTFICNPDHYSTYAISNFVGIPTKDNYSILDSLVKNLKGSELIKVGFSFTHEIVTSHNVVCILININHDHPYFKDFKILVNI